MLIDINENTYKYLCSLIYQDIREESYCKFWNTILQAEHDKELSYKKDLYRFFTGREFYI